MCIFNNCTQLGQLKIQTLYYAIVSKCPHLRVHVSYSTNLAQKVGPIWPTAMFDSETGYALMHHENLHKIIFRAR